jgi:hypothetical protein
MRAATLIRPIQAAARPAAPAVRAVPQSSCLIHTLILAIVWLAFAMSSIVFQRPSMSCSWG